MNALTQSATAQFVAASSDGEAVTAELVFRLLQACIELDRPVWLWGPPGVGKSAIVAQLAKALAYDRLIDIRLSMHGAEDIIGVPFPDLIEKVTRWLEPAIWPRIDGEKVIIFFDEMDRAQQAVLNAALQIVLDRKIGARPLPSSVRIIAAGNGASDRVGTNKLSSALANRFTHIYMKPDAGALRRHYIDIGAPAVMPAFFEYRPALVHGKPLDGEHGFPSSRAWSTVATFLDLPDEIRAPLTRGTVGTAAAHEFEAFFRLFRLGLPPIDALISDAANSMVPSFPGAQFAVAEAIGRVMEFGNVERCITYLDRMPVEFRVRALVAATTRNPALKECRPVIDWRIRNQHVEL